MPTEEVAFFHLERDRVIQRWADRIQNTVSPALLSSPELLSRDDLPRLYGSLLRAFELNQYRDLNQTFDLLVHDGPSHGISATHAKDMLYAMPLAGMDVLAEQHKEARNYALLHDRLEGCRLRLKSVYCKRLAAGAMQVVREQMGEMTDAWERELPTEIISKHFTVVLSADRQQLVEDTLTLYLRMLAGEEEQKVPCREDPTVELSRLECYLAGKVEFFRERGFALGDVQKALAHFESLAEPRLFAAFKEQPEDYRKALMAVGEVVERLAFEFGDRYNHELMRDYYNEVSIMLHRIKNKLTAVPTSLQTILPQTYDGVFIDGDTLSAENGEVLARYEELRTDCLRATVAFLESARPGDDDDSEGLAGLSEQLDELHAKYDALRTFVRENQEAVQAIKRKLSPDAISRVEEFLSDALEGGILTTELTMELQKIQNDLYNREPPVWEPIHIKESLQEAFDESAAEAKGKDIEYTLRIEADDPIVFGIKRQLKRPLAQVINNAIKYTPEGGKVTVSLTESDGHALIAIKDSGIGIPEGEEDLVFGYLTRCTNAQEFNKQGTGTGLYQDRKTVRLHNGDMWAESHGVNKGSTFYIKLPIYARGGEAGADGSQNTEQPVDARADSREAASGS